MSPSPPSPVQPKKASPAAGTTQSCERSCISKTSGRMKKTIRRRDGWIRSSVPYETDTPKIKRSLSSSRNDFVYLFLRWHDPGQVQRSVTHSLQSQPTMLGPRLVKNYAVVYYAYTVPRYLLFVKASLWMFSNSTRQRCAHADIFRILSISRSKAIRTDSL